MNDATLTHVNPKATRIAMRIGSGTDTSGLKWLLGDHLGSTSVVAEGSTGARVAELRYMPWGELRYAYQPTPTDLRYTGQRAEGIGLYLYRSRWYDPQLGRFLSPDAIVPEPYQPLDWDRYQYVQSNPLVYIDPSGHRACKGLSLGSCPPGSDYLPPFEERYGVTFSAGWSGSHRSAVATAVKKTATKLWDERRDLFSTPWDAFRSVYGVSKNDPMLFEWDPDCPECRPTDCGTDFTSDRCNPAFGYTASSHHIKFASRSDYFNRDIRALRWVNNVLHELGHAFNVRSYRSPEEALSVRSDLLRRPQGFYMQSGAGDTTWMQSQELTASEVFADQFLAWVSGRWGLDFFGPMRIESMSSMPDWIIVAIR